MRIFGRGRKGNGELFEEKKEEENKNIGRGSSKT